MIDTAIFQELTEQFDRERSAELKHIAETNKVPGIRYPKTRRLLRKVIVFSQQNPQLSIPNESFYPFGNTELTQRLERAENCREYGFADALTVALEAVQVDLSPEERLEGLIKLGQKTN